MKKLTFTTLRRTHFESFFRKFEVIGFLFTKLSTDSKKSLIFEKRLSFADLSTTHGESFTLPILLLISSREAGCKCKLFSSYGLTRTVIEPKSTVSAADSLCTGLIIKMLLYKNFITNSVVIYRMLCCTFD